MAVIKKAVATAMAIFMAVYGFFGMTGNVSDDYTEGKYKNVILMIGDGMGFNTIEATKAQKGVSMAMETMPVKAQSQIFSFLIPATDSAAGGTALATGCRVWINSVGLFPFDPFTINDFNVPINLCELAKRDGMAAGVVTTDKTSGATPSSFSAHALSRTMEKDISKDQLASDSDLIWGGASASINKENAAENGFTYISTETEMDALKAGSRSFGQFSYSDLYNYRDDNDTPRIAEMTEKAIELLSADEDGFFLMVEGACIDKFSHNNEFEGATMSTIEFDKAVKAALDFAEEDGETLVIVTADHETGGITLDDGAYVFTRGGHSGANVPLLVYGTDKLIADDETINNYEIPIRIAYILGCDETEFPFEIFPDTEK